MLPNLAAAVTGLNSEQSEMTIVANNIANQTTPGYKGQEGDFATLLSQTINAGQAPNSTTGQGGINPYQMGMGTQFAGVATNQAQGTIAQTGNPLDFALQGNGFFVVKGSQGTNYTRAGQMALDAAGNLTDRLSGQIVQGYSAVTPPSTGSSPTVGSMGTTVTNIQVPPEIKDSSGHHYKLASWSVGQDGTVTATYNATNSSNATQTLAETLGQVLVATVPNPGGMVAVGTSLFTAGPDAGTVSLNGGGSGGAGQVIQGALENSNSNVVQQMAQLVETNGSYDANAKVVTISQSMEQALANMIQ